MDLHVIPFKNVYNFSDPTVALSHWIDLFLDVINKHAPLKKRRSKKKTKTKNNNKNEKKKKKNEKTNKHTCETANPSTMAEH